ncbi:hypothetical protein [Aliarcobacter skirrowii]|jgi:hypothetical protein|uniref:Uncharacterized protein n=1 Tax=Aliarcobacter skirrowii TaxID=28200 RepID=A0AAW9DAN2_9BACT|nr:hypothetical protein [Aliarcobacter skirrowii]MDX4069139.1 hypothetical protein [Aliarcobacter skirrowii]
MRFNQSEFAALVGCSQQNISKLIKKDFLEVGQDKKLDVENSLQRLRDFNLLDENNKLKKSRTPKKENKKEIEVSLPLEAEDVGYKTLADLTDEEKTELEKEREKAYRELEIKKKEAQEKNIDLDDDFREFNYAASKAHREHYMGQLAELDYKIKLGEYISKVEVEQTFFEASRTVRDMLLNFPSKMASRVIGKKEIKEIEMILSEEIRFILGNLTK